MFSLMFVWNVLWPLCNLFPFFLLNNPRTVPMLSRRTAHIPDTSRVFQDALGDVWGQGCWATVRGSSRTAANSSHLLERIARLWRRIFCYIIQFCPFPIFAAVWNFGTVWYIPFQRRLWILQCSYRLWGSCGLNICGKDRNPIYFVFLPFVSGKVYPGTPSACLFFWVFFWRPGPEWKRYMANYVTFIFPLNLEHSSPPCRIQNWSLTFSLVPSLAWSHFLSIWFLAPYATFLFPACRQQGVALLSPS